jgi:hypothetical protein
LAAYGVEPENPLGSDAPDSEGGIAVPGIEAAVDLETFANPARAVLAFICGSGGCSDTGRQC